MLGIFLISGVLLTGFLKKDSIRISISEITARIGNHEYQRFPEVDQSSLSSNQKKLLAILKQEYTKKPTSYDDTVLKYTQGNKEAWCANFTSWAMDEAGMPYNNPNYGGWRIPGVLTLKSYYDARGGFTNSESYVPKLGDVAIYDGKHTFGLMHRQHVAIVVKADENSITTFGGNEGGKTLIKTHNRKIGEQQLVGYGVLDDE